jgi:hypothetical protein
LKREYPQGEGVPRTASYRTPPSSTSLNPPPLQEEEYKTLSLLDKREYPQGEGVGKYRENILRRINS